MGWVSKHQSKIESTKLLVVGAGGIGCELLKNLAATGFKQVHVVDLDTIDVSNLNRQFLFRRDHVGSSKAEVATKAVQKFNPSCNLTFSHDSIFEDKFNLDFFQKFDVVLNALDNRKARNHVNRMCSAARIPLIESGTAGYLGQVTVHIRDKTECFECTQKDEAQKTFPGCTIRNTPSEHIHCTVWAKHVFNQLFGEIDIDDDVSPDLNDPENIVEENANEKMKESPEKEEAVGNTRQWAESVKYDPMQIFEKLFLKDIDYLCKMEHLWKQRKRPNPLSFERALSEGEQAVNTIQQAITTDDQVWSIASCSQIFAECVKQLYAEQLEADDKILTFDKDYRNAMIFVSVCANIRAFIFGIATKSMFDIKAMAGNIIPAIASTNAIVAGLIVSELMKVIYGKIDEVHGRFCQMSANTKGQIIMQMEKTAPNPKCYVCSNKNECFVILNPEEMTVRGLNDKVLKGRFNMEAADVTDVFTQRIILSSDGDTDALLDKKLSELSIQFGAILSCDDFDQDFEMKIFIKTNSDLKGDDFFVEQIGESKMNVSEVDGSGDLLEDDGSRKRRGGDDEEEEVEPKRPRIDAGVVEVKAS